MSPEIPSSEIRLLEESQQFLRSAVHDLRAHQRRIHTAAELMLEATSDQDRAGFSRQISDGLAKAEQLLSAIGKYSLCLNPSAFAMTSFPLGSAARFAIANLEREITATGATVELGDLPEVTGDRDRLTEVFEHLISNSLKYKSSVPPRVSIGAACSPGGWVISLSDNGEGIPDKYRDRLFLPFRRLHGSDTPGAGLGLAACRKIVEGHGGRIWIDTQDSPGVTFSFTLHPPNGS